MGRRSRVGDRIEGQASRLGPEGAAVVVHEGRDLLVEGLFPTERALLRIEHLSRHHPRGHARVLERLEAHPRRREPPCPRHVAHPEGECSGCPLMALHPEAQREAKAQRVREELGLPLDRVEHDERVLGYRGSAKRVVARTRGTVVLGSYRKGSHHIADMHGCLVDHPLLEASFAELERALRRAPAEAPTPIRFAWAKTNGQEVMLTVVVAAPAQGAQEARTQAWMDELAASLSVPQTFAWSTHEREREGNRMRGTNPRIVRGPAVLTLGEDRYGPDDFLQPNAGVAARARADLLADPSGEALGGELAWDLYAGTGTTTTRLRARFTRVEGCELDPSSAALAGVRAASAEAFVASHAAASPPPALVIANPPRSGFGAAVAGGLLELRSPRVQIMSCNPESLARDLEHLTSAYTLEQVRGYDTLPQTAHLELVAWLRLAP